MLRAILWVLTLARVVFIPFFVVAGLTAQELARAGEDPSVPRFLALGLVVVMG